MTDTATNGRSDPAAGGLVATPPTAVPGPDYTGMAGGDNSRLQHFGAGNFPNIADYAFLSDCESNCLIAPSGAVEWLCLPRPDSPSVFTALLDRSGGSFRVGPFGVQVPAARGTCPARWCWRPRGRPRPAG